MVLLRHADFKEQVIKINEFELYLYWHWVNDKRKEKEKQQERDILTEKRHNYLIKINYGR